MEWECTHGKMETSTMDNGKKATRVATAFGEESKEIPTWENGRDLKRTVMESTPGVQVINMMESGVIASNTDKEQTFSQTETNI